MRVFIKVFFLANISDILAKPLEVTYFLQNLQSTPIFLGFSTPRAPKILYPRVNVGGGGVNKVTFA